MQYNIRCYYTKASHTHGKAANSFDDDTMTMLLKAITAFMLGDIIEG